MSHAPILISLSLAVLAVGTSYRRRSRILAPEPPEPSVTLACVLLMDLAAALLLLVTAWSSPPSPVLLLLPMLILVGYVALLVLVFVIRPEWRKSQLFLLGAFAPLLGCVFAFLVLFAERARRD